MFSCCVSKDDQQEFLAPNTAPSAADRVSAEDAGAKIFTFTVQKSGDKDMLGMDVKHKKGMWLVVAKIDEGAVARANASGLNGETLQISDVIYEINGVKGDDALMVAECKKSSKLEMKVKRMSTPM
ncbi:unnamed protein product [Symbiodinium sp. CCMP2592]|nr:unnamed protein product [Symbiodinium sp. CCMP2592]|mmetsp:Transcript_107326/g.149652  ORF Transcript_107326/g.149652 Transcript_107326/m.149652 type:complete len:126 (+) Transcript_107326:73-450(+)